MKSSKPTIRYMTAAGLYSLFELKCKRQTPEDPISKIAQCLLITLCIAVTVCSWCIVSSGHCVVGALCRRGIVSSRHCVVGAQLCSLLFCCWLQLMMMQERYNRSIDEMNTELELLRQHRTMMQEQLQQLDELRPQLQ